MGSLVFAEHCSSIPVISVRSLAQEWFGKQGICSIELDECQYAFAQRSFHGRQLSIVHAGSRCEHGRAWFSIGGGELYALCLLRNGTTIELAVSQPEMNCCRLYCNGEVLGTVKCEGGVITDRMLGLWELFDSQEGRLGHVAVFYPVVYSVQAQMFGCEVPVVVQARSTFVDFVKSIVNLLTIGSLTKWLRIWHLEGAAIPTEAKGWVREQKLYYVAVCLLFRGILFPLDFGDFGGE